MHTIILIIPNIQIMDLAFILKQMSSKTKSATIKSPTKSRAFSFTDPLFWHFHRIFGWCHTNYPENSVRGRKRTGIYLL